MAQATARGLEQRCRKCRQQHRRQSTAGRQQLGHQSSANPSIISSTQHLQAFLPKMVNDSAIITKAKTDSIAQASESRLYTFSPETKTALRKFRLGTSRAKDPQAVICKQNTDP